MACTPATPTGRDAPHAHVPKLREPACVPLAWENQGHGRAALTVAAEGTRCLVAQRIHAVGDAQDGRTRPFWFLAEVKVFSLPQDAFLLAHKSR
jgi:hypothetical protein